MATASKTRFTGAKIWDTGASPGECLQVREYAAGQLVSRKNFADRDLMVNLNGAIQWAIDINEKYGVTKFGKGLRCYRISDWTCIPVRSSLELIKTGIKIKREMEEEKFQRDLLRVTEELKVM